MRTTATLAILLLAAAALVTAVLYGLAESGPCWAVCWLLGVSVAQVQLAAAAVVFLPRWLPLRVAALATAVCVWAGMLDAVTLTGWNEWTALLSGTALATAALCLVIHFFGWRLQCSRRRPPADARPRQFCLQTLLLWTTLVAVYSGLLRWTGFVAGFDGRSVVLFAMLAALGSSAFWAAVGVRLSWPPLGMLFAAACLSFAGLFHLTGQSVWQTPIHIVAAQLLFLIAILSVLRVAGVRLALAEDGAERTIAPSGPIVGASSQ